MVARPAGFDRDHSWRKLLKECEHLLASRLLSQNRLLSGVRSVKMKIVFRRIHANSASSTDGLLWLRSTATLSGTLDAVGGRPHQQMAEVAVPRQMFAEILSLIAQLRALPALA
jgi:hypothetical protein